jgi:type IV secretory pathway TrbL component
MKNYRIRSIRPYPIRFHQPSCACACGDGVCLSGARSHHGSWAAGATATVVDGAAESRNMDGRPAGAAQGNTGHTRSA